MYCVAMTDVAWFRFVSFRRVQIELAREIHKLRAHAEALHRYKDRTESKTLRHELDAATRAVEDDVAFLRGIQDGGYAEACGTPTCAAALADEAFEWWVMRTRERVERVVQASVLSPASHGGGAGAERAADSRRHLMTLIAYLEAEVPTLAREAMSDARLKVDKMLERCESGTVMDLSRALEMCSLPGFAEFTERPRTPRASEASAKTAKTTKSPPTLSTTPARTKKSRIEVELLKPSMLRFDDETDDYLDSLEAMYDDIRVQFESDADDEYDDECDGDDEHSDGTRDTHSDDTMSDDTTIDITENGFMRAESTEGSHAEDVCIFDLPGNGALSLDELSAGGHASLGYRGSTHVDDPVMGVCIRGTYVRDVNISHRLLECTLLKLPIGEEGALDREWQLWNDADGDDDVDVGDDSEKSGGNSPPPKRKKSLRASKFPLTYPRHALPALENPKLFERLDIDALFFSFYYRQNTRWQLLAANELHRSHWRFHTKLGTWFARLEEPKSRSEESETGAVIYFDFRIGENASDHSSSGWCQRSKSEFVSRYADFLP